MARSAVKKTRFRKLNPKNPDDRKIARQVDAAVVAATRLYRPRIIKESKLRKPELRRLFRAVRKQVLVDLNVVIDRYVPGDGTADEVVGCGAHIDACSALAEPCGQDSWFPGCDDQVDCTSEACSSEFMCAGSHICEQNVCSDNTCHSEVFDCRSYEVGCTADAPQCAVDQPQCAIDEPQCAIDEPTDTCLIDEPTTPCPGEDEGSDCFVHVDDDEVPREVVSLFASPVWRDIVMDIAVKGADLDRRIGRASISIEEDLFHE